MIATLAELVAPLSEREFLDLLRARRLAFCPAPGANRLQSLVDWETLRRAIEADDFRPKKLRVTHNTHPVPAAFYTQSGKVDAGKLAGLMRQGVSLLVERINEDLPALGALCATIGAGLGEEVMAAAVMTDGGGGALELHYDSYDVVVLQIEGAKHWRVYPPTVRDPVRGMVKEAPPPPGEPIFDRALQTGELLLVPAGYWHQCDKAAERSLHVSIAFLAPTGWHVVAALVPQLLTEGIFRVPLSRLGDAAERAAHESALKERLVERVSQMSVFGMSADAEAITRDWVPPAQD